MLTTDNKGNKGEKSSPTTSNSSCHGLKLSKTTKALMATFGILLVLPTLLVMTTTTTNTLHSWMFSSASSADKYAVTDFNNGVEGWSFDKHTPLNRCNAKSLRLIRTTRLNGTVNNFVAHPRLFYQNVRFYADWEGRIYAQHATDGTFVWQVNLRTLTGRPTAFSRSLALDLTNNQLISGDFTSAHLFAFDLTTGALNWNTTTPLNSHFLARMLSSLIVYKGYIYAGMSSGEEGGALCVNQQICSFRGTMSKVKAKTGQVIKTQYMSPPLNGTNPQNWWAGGAIWGGPPVIDIKRKWLIFGTGQDYHRPQHVTDCLAAGGGAECAIEPLNLSNSIVALDLDTLDVVHAAKFVYTLTGGPGVDDVYTLACSIDSLKLPVPRLPSCPPFFGPDADFTKVILVTVVRNGTDVDLAIAANKAGVSIALDRNTWEMVWTTKTGPAGASAGGISFGASTDGRYLYYNNVNSGPADNPSGADGTGTLWSLVNPIGGLNQTKGGFWSVVEVSSGRIVWQKAEPSGARIVGPITVFKDGLFASGTMSKPHRNLFVLDSSNGDELFSDSAFGSRYSTLDCNTIVEPGSPNRYTCFAANGYYPPLKPFYGADPNVYEYEITEPDLRCPDPHGKNGDHEDD